MSFKPTICECGTQLTEATRSTDIFLCKECKAEQDAERAQAMAAVGNTPDERFEISYRSARGITKGKVSRLSLSTDSFGFDECQAALKDLETEGHKILSADLRA